MRKRFALTVAAAFALLAAACGRRRRNEPPATVDPNAEHDPVTLEMWIPFSAEHEVAGVQATFDAFEAEYRGSRWTSRPGSRTTRRPWPRSARGMRRTPDVVGAGRPGGVLRHGRVAGPEPLHRAGR